MKFQCVCKEGVYPHRQKLNLTWLAEAQYISMVLWMFSMVLYLTNTL